MHGGSAGITLETFGVVGIPVAIEVSGRGASTSAGGLLELESNDFREFTSLPKLAVTISLISGATLNKLAKFFFLLQTYQIAIMRAIKRVTPITIWTVKIALGGMDNG